MNPDRDKDTIDTEVRRYVYDHLIQRGKPPSAAETAEALRSTLGDVNAAYQRLAQGRVLVLQGSGEILMANPFSAVPTPFLVEAGNRSWWGNCIWDALGIPAMFRQDARIISGCGDCNDSMVVTVKGGSLSGASGILHFAVPAKHWWDNIVFT